MKKRLIAAILTFALIFTMVPVVAMAGDPVFPTIAANKSTYEILENTNGSKVTEESTTYFKYEIPSDVTLTDQSIDVGMTMWNQYNQNMPYYYDSVSYVLRSNIDTIQTKDNQWGTGAAEGYTVTFSWVNASTGEVAATATSFKVKIVDNPLTDVTYNKDTIDVFAYSNGYYEKDLSGNVSFRYREDSIKPTIVSATSNGNVVSVGADNSLVYNSQWYNTSASFTQPLTIGSNAAKISVMGLEKDYTINLKTPGLKDRIDRVEVSDIEVEEGTNYNLYPEFKVYYKDGTVGYSSEEEYNPYWITYSDVIDKTAYSVGVFFENEDKSTWTAGTTQKGTLYFLGDEYEFDLSIVSSSVKKIDTSAKMDVPECKNIQNSIEENIKELPITITYQNGNVETVDYKDLDGVSFSGYFNYPANVGDKCNITISYKGASTVVEAKLVAPAISSVEIDESTVGKIYYNPNPINGSSNYTWAASTGVKATINYTDGDSEKITFNYDGYVKLSHNGVRYIAILESEGEAALNNVKYKLSVGSITDYADVTVLDSSVTVSSVECLSKPTKNYYIGDSFFSDCKSDFDPHIFVGLKIKVTMSNGDEVILSGDDLYRQTIFDQKDMYADGGFSHNMFFVLGDRNATKTSIDLYANILGTEYFICKMTRTESPYKSLEIIDRPSDDQLSEFDGSGLKFKLTYKNGTEKTITLGTPLKGEYGFGCTMLSGGYDLDEGFLGDGGFTTPGYDNSISGIRYNVWDISDVIGEQEYATIVWNNGVLRLGDQMVVIDPDKYNTTTGNNDVKVDTSLLSAAAIDGLKIDDRFAVEQQGQALTTTVKVDEVKASNKITVAANKDDTEIKNCYDINFSYSVNDKTYNLTELSNGKIAVTILLDESLWGAAKEDIVLYREHEYADGTKVEQITDFTISDDGKYITFESDKFSTFAIGLTDETPVSKADTTKTTEDESVAYTADTTPIAATVMLLWSSGLCAYAASKRRKVEE